MDLQPLCNTLAELDAMLAPLAIITPAKVITEIQDARTAHAYREILREILLTMDEHDLESVSRDVHRGRHPASSRLNLRLGYL